MKKLLTAAALMLTATGIAQLPVTQLAPAQETAGEARPAKKPVRRLPPYFAQIGLSEKQRESIYELQDACAQKVDVLRKQIDALETSCDSDIQAVLTPEQKKSLDEKLAAAAKNAAERRKPKAE